MENNVDQEITCPACGKLMPSDLSYCTNCGRSLQNEKKALDLLNSDPELKELNDKYANQGFRRWISGAICITSVLIFYAWLEYDIFEFLSSVALLTFPISLIFFIAFSIKRSATRKNILQALADRGIEK